MNMMRNSTRLVSSLGGENFHLIFSFLALIGCSVSNAYVDSHMHPGPLARHLDMCTKIKLRERKLSVNNTTTTDIFHNFFESERLLTNGLMNSDRLCEQVLQIVISGNLSFS